MIKNFQNQALFDLKETIAAELLTSFSYPFEALPHIAEYILKTGRNLDPELYQEVSPSIWVAKSATIAPSALLKGPLIIGEETEIRHCAHIRGAVIIGNHCVVGTASELKNSILMNHVQVPHYNYVGDSILGSYAHLGAGVICSNVKGDRQLIELTFDHEILETKLKKFSCLLGDHAEIGCNSVLNPGTIIGKNSRIYPLSSVRGYVPENHILKQDKLIKIT